MVDVVNCTEEAVATTADEDATVAEERTADEDGTITEERMADEDGTIAVERMADEDGTTTADEDWRALQDLRLCERREVYVH